MHYRIFTVYRDLHLFWHAVSMFPYDDDGDNNDDSCDNDDGLVIVTEVN